MGTSFSGKARKIRDKVALYGKEQLGRMNSSVGWIMDSLTAGGSGAK